MKLHATLILTIHPVILYAKPIIIPTNLGPYNLYPLKENQCHVVARRRRVHCYNSPRETSGVAHRILLHEIFTVSCKFGASLSVGTSPFRSQ